MRPLTCACLAAVLLLLPLSAVARQRPPTAPVETPSRPATASPAPATPAAGSADASEMADIWLVIYNVLPARTADFEALALRVRGAMSANAAEHRRAQASLLRIYRSAVPNPDGNIVYFVQVPTRSGRDDDRTGLDVVIDDVLPAESTKLRTALQGMLEPNNPTGNTLMLAIQ